MKTKRKQHVLFAILLCCTLFWGIFPLAASADEGSSYVAWIGETGYTSLEDAVNSAKSGDTITLGRGKYTLYKKGADTKGKDLTFVGQGVDATAWGIGADIPDPAHFGTEYNSDYSFDGSGTITFRNMTLQSSTADYLGFVRVNHTVVDNCTINGKTFYWGYKTASFTNTTFNCPAEDYALWTYSSPQMAFDGCTFNSSGKTINVYTDYGAGKYDIGIIFRNCTVNNSGTPNKSVLNINDSNMGKFKYRINISGTNAINNVSVGSNIFRDPVTCTRWFGFGGKASTNNTKRSVISIDGITVFENGDIAAHEIDTENDKHTEGYKDDAYTLIKGDWKEVENGQYERVVKVVCNYCNRDDEWIEEGYAVTYTDGVENEEIFKDQTTIVPVNTPTPVFEGDTPSRDGYSFKGWNPQVEKTVTKSTTCTAIWEKKTASKPTTPMTPNKPTKMTKVVSPKTGDTGNTLLMFILLLISGGCVAAHKIFIGKMKK